MEGDLLSQAGCTLTLADPSLTVDTLPSYVQVVPTAVDACVPHLPEDDQTVEILMTELDPATADKFYHHAGESDGLEGGQRVDVGGAIDARWCLEARPLLLTTCNAI